jgi:hypothetical protein
MPDKTPAETTTSWDKPFPTVADILKTMDQIKSEPPGMIPQFSFPPIRVEPCQFITAQPEWRQFRFPRSRKKRIRRKWAKNLRNFRYVEMQNIYLVKTQAFGISNMRVTSEMTGPPVVIGSPKVIAKLEAEVRRLNRETDCAMIRSIANGG